MILDDAPPILIVNIHKSLSKDAMKTLRTMQAMAQKDEQTMQRIQYLLDLQKKFADSGVGWVPIPLDLNYIPTLPTDYKTTTVKRLQFVDGTPFLTGSLNSSTINFSTNDSNLFNMLLAIVGQLFSMPDNMPRVHFMSKKLLVVNGFLLSVNQSMSEKTTEQIISLEFQQGNLDSPLSMKNVESKTKEIIELTDDLITS